MQRQGTGAASIFGQEFLITLRSLVGVHHSIYLMIPPQGIYFEALVEKAFKQVRQPFLRVKTTAPNVPKHDLVVGEARLSLKTETGHSTNPDYIQITKLCTTEREPWAPKILVRHAVDGKCQIRELAVADCRLLLSWDLQISD